MQNLRCLFTLVLLCNIVDVTGMEPVAPHQSINQSSNIASLQNLCINAIRQNVTSRKCDLNRLTSAHMMEQFSSLPAHLSKQIVGQVFYHKSHPELDSKLCKNAFCSNIEFNEHNQKMIVDHNKCKEQLETYSLKGELVSSLPWPEQAGHEVNGLLRGQIDIKTGSTITIAKDDKIIASSACPNKYPCLMAILQNEQEALLCKEGEWNLFNFVTSSVSYPTAKAIVFNKPETLCVVEKEKTITVIDRSNAGQNKKFKIPNVDRWSLSPSGKILFLAHDGQPGELFSTADMSVVFSNKLMPEKMFITFTRSHSTDDDVSFDNTERYAIARQACRNQEYIGSILDIQSQNVCLSFELPMNYKTFFYEKYFAIVGTVNKQGIIYLINKDDLQNTAINKNCVYTLDDLTQLPITKIFKGIPLDRGHTRDNSYIFHPSGDFIVINAHDTWELVHIASGAIVARAKNILRHSFSKPKGDIIKFDYAKDKGVGIFSLRNDLNISEYLLMRFMAEKKITPAELSQHPHLNEIYNSMDEDKRSSSFSRRGMVKS